MIDSQTTIQQEQFQSTPLREGRPDSQVFDIADYRFQSTPLREGRPFAIENNNILVSIHAPT